MEFAYTLSQAFGLQHLALQAASFRLPYSRTLLYSAEATHTTCNMYPEVTVLAD